MKIGRSPVLFPSPPIRQILLLGRQTVHSVRSSCGFIIERERQRRRRGVQNRMDLVSVGQQKQQQPDTTNISFVGQSEPSVLSLFLVTQVKSCRCKNTKIDCLINRSLIRLKATRRSSSHFRSVEQGEIFLLIFTSPGIRSPWGSANHREMDQEVEFYVENTLVVHYDDDDFAIKYGMC